ncbi:hypothetical protein H1R20_g11191, partial [Candolleomyces eurysporus]
MNDNQNGDSTTNRACLPPRICRILDNTEPDGTVSRSSTTVPALILTSNSKRRNSKFPSSKRRNRKLSNSKRPNKPPPTMTSTPSQAAVPVILLLVATGNANQNGQGTSDQRRAKFVMLKMTLSGAVPFIPDPFKGPAVGLLKIIDVFEQAKSNKEEMEELKALCDLLNESMVNAIKGQDERLLSTELKESIGRLVKGIHNTFLATVVEYSTGMAAYVMVEDNVWGHKGSQPEIGSDLAMFLGALILSDIRQTVKDQGGWMVKLCGTIDNHFKSATLDKLKHVPGAAYDSYELAKVNPCFEGTRVKLLAGIGRWVSNTALEEQETRKPIYVLDGIAGIGKSTVAKTVAQRAAAINSLGATFFFSRDHADRQHAAGFVHTIAYQLACCDPSYGRAIATAIDDHPDTLYKVMAQQFSTLVAEPLKAMLEQRATPLVFVFDALDECAQPDGSDILSLIITSISQLPNVKVFLTTRPDLGLREIEALIVDSDIRLYLDYHLSPSNIQKVFKGTEWNSWAPEKPQKEQLPSGTGSRNNLD